MKDQQTPTPPQQPDQSSRKKPLNDYVKYSAMGFQMLAMILAGAGIGYLLDKNFGKPGSSTFTAIFTVIFVIASMVWVIRQLLQGQNK